MLYIFINSNQTKCGDSMIEAFLNSILSLFVLLLITKWLGYRQIAQLSLYDYIIGITIGSICAEMAIMPTNEILIPLTGLITYGLITYLLSVITQKSTSFRYFLEGKPLLLFHDQQFNFLNLKKSKLDLLEFLSECRQLGYFDLKEIDTVILEPNGKLSILPLAPLRPATPQDLSIKVGPAKPVYHLILDGQINLSNLKSANKNEDWLNRQLTVQGVQLKDVFLASLSDNSTLTVYKKST